MDCSEKKARRVQVEPIWPPGQLTKGMVQVDYFVCCACCHEEANECDADLTMFQAARAFKEGGWVKRNGKWLCPDCTDCDANEIGLVLR